MKYEKVVVHKNRQTGDIETYVNIDGHGARCDLDDFMRLVADIYGSPAMTMTKKGHVQKMQAASQQAIREMKKKTREVAAMNVAQALLEKKE
jgi:hypothetical protein